MAFDSSNAFAAAHSIFKRCVECESAAPKCPSCDTGYTCTMISRSCDQCATTKCIKTSSSSSDDSSSGGGTNAGAIAGGVIGGVAFIAIVTFLIWWFVIRKKREEYAQRAATEGEKSTTTPGSARTSRKSTNSIASTVLTRASNVIQIAYIPGVTNRSPPETPLVPPVPPLPGAAPDQHFFMPGDLRDSSWSDMTTERRSIAPSLRSSVATTIYRNNAIVSPMPAQQVMRTRAAVVSIHNGPNGEQTETLAAPPDAPAVPAITQAQLAKAGVTEKPHPGSSIVARTVTAKPVMVKTKGSKKKNNTSTSPASQTTTEQSESSGKSTPQSSKLNQVMDQSSSGFDASSDEEDETHPKTASTKPTETAQPEPQSRAPTVIEDSPAVNQGPFNDQDQSPAETSSRASSHLETNDGTRSNRHSRGPPPRVESPFSDANEVK